MRETYPYIFWNDRNGKLHLTEFYNTCEVIAILPNVSSCANVPEKYKSIGRMIRKIDGVNYCIVTGQFYDNKSGYKLS